VTTGGRREGGNARLMQATLGPLPRGKTPLWRPNGNAVTPPVSPAYTQNFV
jgi:hypothetical protein